MANQRFASQKVVERWRLERAQWLRRQGINPRASDWRLRLRHLEPNVQREFFACFSTRWHAELDACQGACVLRDPDNARLVADSLLYANGRLYELTDFVIMPNHVHLLGSFPSEEAILTQCESWKHYTATQLNRRLEREGRFWQQDGFDHLVRSQEQFEHFRRYIADNPRRAGLTAGECFHWTQ